MLLKAGEGMAKPAASPGPGGITGSRLRGLVSLLLGHTSVLGSEAVASQGWAPQEESRASRGTDSSFLSPLQKLQELRAREIAVSNLGSLRNDDIEEAWGWTPSWAEQERTAVQVSSAVPMSLPLLRIPGGPFGWR